MKLQPLVLTFASALLAGACRSPAPGPYVPVEEQTRSTVEAERLTRKAADLARKDPGRAEQLLVEALTADIFYGPAHNNLGVLLLKQDRLYEAANEFEWARKLMPGNAEARLNLGLTLERAGQRDNALGTYRAALEVAPEHIASQQALASLLLRSGRDQAELGDLLEEISLRGETAAWREWAKAQLLRLER